MLISWVILILSALVFAGAIVFLKDIPGARDFRRMAGGLGILGITIAAVRGEWRWHLLWYTPVALAIAYVFALRGLFMLSQRINKIGMSGVSDPDEIRRALKSAVNEFNRKAPDDEQIT